MLGSNCNFIFLLPLPAPVQPLSKKQRFLLELRGKP